MENRPLAYRMSPMSFADYIGQGISWAKMPP